MGQTKFNSVVLGSYFLAQSVPGKDGDKGSKPAGEYLHRIRAARSCPVNGLVFETMVRTFLKLCLSVVLQCMQARLFGHDMESMLLFMHCECSINLALFGKLASHNKACLGRRQPHLATWQQLQEEDCHPAVHTAAAAAAAACLALLSSLA